MMVKKKINRLQLIKIFYGFLMSQNCIFKYVFIWNWARWVRTFVSNGHGSRTVIVGAHVAVFGMFIMPTNGFLIRNNIFSFLLYEIDQNIKHIFMCARVWRCVKVAKWDMWLNIIQYHCSDVIKHILFLWEKLSHQIAV